MLIISVNSIIPCLFILLKSKYTYTTATSKALHFDTYPNPNSPCAHLFILIIFDPISHIYAVHTQRKVYHSMPLHTYTVNFATSSNLQEMLLAYRLHSNDLPF